MIPAFRTLFTAALALAPLFAPAGEPEKTAAAITRALPFIQAGGAKWIEDKKCISCHHVAFTTWSLQAAKDRGFEIDAARLAEWQKWSRESLLEKRDDGVVVGSTNLEGASQILFATRPQPGEPTEAEKPLFDFLVAGQREDGAWTAGGQLPSQKRPKPETDAASTMWNALALGTATGDSYRAARGKALAWLATQPEDVSTEPYAARLLLAAQSGGDTSEPKAKLLALQHEDGGWGWLAADPSDALATGLALYALRYAGSPADDTSVTRAVAFLTSTQNPDGSWTVHGTKENAKDRPAETASYWGTCWATIALTSTLPEKH